MNYPLYLARRLSLESSGRRSSPAVKVASAAVALSVIVMLASIAVVTGFKNEIVRKVVGFNSDVQIYVEDMGDGSDNVVTLTPTLRSVLDTATSVSDYSLQISVPGVFKTTDDFKGVYLRGVNDKASRSFVAENLEEGKVPTEDGREVAVSRIAASQLGLKVGDNIDTYFFSDDIRVRRLTVSGIYNTHFDTYDDVIGYTSLPLLQKLAGVSESQGSSIKVSVPDFNRVSEYADNLQHTLDRELASGMLARKYRVSTVEKAGAAYFQWLALLDTNVVVILALMVLVGCVTLTGGMLMIILDKKRFIGLMKALGAPTSGVRKVFIYLAMRVALIGMAIGNVLAIGLLWAQKEWHFLKLDPDSYYIDFVPVSLNWLDIVTLDLAVLLIAYLVLILPSRFVAGISPAETMRYE